MRIKGKTKVVCACKDFATGSKRLFDFCSIKNTILDSDSNGSGTELEDVINNLSDFVFSAIKAIGAILLGFGIVQIGLALKGHDASQRAQGFMTFFGGVVIYFAKDILDMIL